MVHHNYFNNTYDVFSKTNYHNYSFYYTVTLVTVNARENGIY